MKPRAPINTPDKARLAREYLGLDKAGLAKVFKLGAAGRETVRRVEKGGNRLGVPGPYGIALEALLTGFRPRGVVLPIDKEPNQ